MKRVIYSIVVLCLLFLAVGCDYGNANMEENKTEKKNVTVELNEPTIKTEKDTTLEGTTLDGEKSKIAKELVTVDEFKKFYGIEDTEIPDEYIEKFIGFYGYSLEDLKNLKGNQFLILKKHYEEGKVYGYSLANKFGTKNVKPDTKIEDFIYNTDYIYFDFAHYTSSTDACYFDKMVIDFKHKIICYGGDEFNYSDGENILKANLSDEEISEIREEIVKHINTNNMASELKPTERNYYSFNLWFISDKDGNVGVRGYGFDEKGYPGLDGYWKGLYKRYFGEDYKL